MKKSLLLFLGIFVFIATTNATNNNTIKNKNAIIYTYADAVNFIERGIEFYIYPNGEFNFNTSLNNSYYNRRNRNVSIHRDYNGKIRRVGNAYINYNRYGNVSQIGNISIRYYRGQLASVGNLNIRYDNWGYPIFYGNVRTNFYHNNGVRFNLNIGDVCDYNDSYFSHRDFRRNYAQIREDRNYYYYKAHKNAKIGKRSQILRRRKPVVTHRDNTVRKPVKRDNSYRRPVERNNKNRKAIKHDNSYRKQSTERKNNKRAVTTNKSRKYVERKTSTRDYKIDRNNRRY